jgi:hypothetical protein
MKYKLIFLTFTLLIIISCSREKITDTSENENKNENSIQSYFPLAKNNKWIYNVHSEETKNSNKVVEDYLRELWVIKDPQDGTVGGLPAYKVSFSRSFPEYVYFNVSGDDLIRIYDLDAKEWYTWLPVYMNVNDKWKVYDLRINDNNGNLIKELHTDRTFVGFENVSFNNSSFQNCLKIEENNIYKRVDNSVITAYTSKEIYWYFFGVGIVKIHREISYTEPEVKQVIIDETLKEYKLN